MSFHVVAMEPRDFAQWLANEGAPAQPPRDAAGATGPAPVPGRAAAAPATPCAAPRPPGTIGPDLTHVGGRHVARRRDACPTTRPTFARWIRDNQHIKPEQPHAALRDLRRARARARASGAHYLGGSGWQLGDERWRAIRASQPRAAPAGRARGARADLGDADAAGGFVTAVNNTMVGLLYLGAAFLFFLLAGVLALLMRTQLAVGGQPLHQPGALQPDVHRARHDDDVPVRGAGDRGARRHAAAADAGGARPAVPAAQRLRDLGLHHRRTRVLLDDLLRPRAGGRLVHVSAAHAHGVLAGRQRRFLAARHRLHRDLGDRRRGRDRRRHACARARRACRSTRCRSSPGRC